MYKHYWYLKDDNNILIQAEIKSFGQLMCSAYCIEYTVFCIPFESVRGRLILENRSEYILQQESLYFWDWL